MARALADISSAALQYKVDGKGITPQQSDKVVNKMNQLFGAPPTYHGVFGDYGLGSGITSDQFSERHAGGPRRPRMMMPQPKGMTPPTFGGLGDRMDWMRQGAEKGASVTNNYENTGNDQRTQTANVTVNASGLEQVGAMTRDAVSRALSSMGASVVKGNSAATGDSTAP